MYPRELVPSRLSDLLGLLQRYSSQWASPGITASFIAVFTFLLLFSLRAVQQTSDGLVYAVIAKAADQGTYHPHHLLMVPLVNLCLSGISLMGGTRDFIFAGQMHSLFWAIVMAVSFFLVAERALDSRLLGLLATTFLIVTQGFWVYSTQLEVYIPAAGCLSLLAAILIVRSNVRLAVWEIIAISLLLALSIFYNLLNLVFCIPLSYYLLVTQGKKAGLAVLSVSGLMVLSVYLWVFSTTDGSSATGVSVPPAGNWVNRFLDFCLYSYRFHPSQTLGTFGYLNAEGIVRIFDSQVKSFVFTPSEGRLLIRIAAAVLFGGIFLVLCAFNMVRIIGHSPDKHLRTFLLVWTITYPVFFAYWGAAMYKFFVLTLFSTVLLMFLSLKDVMGRLKDSRHGPKIVMAATVLLMVFIGVLNLTKAVLPFHTSRGPSYEEAAKLVSIAPQGYIILTDFDVMENLRYYFDREKVGEVFEVHMPLLYFYRGRPLHEHYDLKKGRGMIVSSSYVVPEFTIYRVSPFNGLDNPKGWLEFMGWLFDFEFDTGHQLISCREFKVITDDAGASYLLLSPSRRKINGLNELFRMLDSQIKDPNGKNENVFLRWLSNVYTRGNRG